MKARNRWFVILTIFLLILVVPVLKLPKAAPVVQGQTTEPSCTDSDGGLDYEVAGYVEGIGPDGWPYTKYDLCETSGTYEGQLREFFCNGTMPWPKFYQCPYGCADGACMPATCTDADGDGYAVEGGACGSVDCDDANPDVNPSAAEVCDNGSDDDCDDLIDADDPECVVCTDADGDGYAVEGGVCGTVDCDDADPDVNPGATEVCDNGSDDDCDGLIDADDPECVVCTDADGDGYAVEGGVCGTVDCDDADPDVNPGAAEVCDNGSDDDCDGLIDADDPECAGGEPSCTDSDGGLNYEVAGYVEGIGPNGWPYTKYDLCETSGTYEGQLKEFFCNGTTPWPQFHQCPYGCADGACLPPTCTDSDGDGYAVEGGACGSVDCDDADPDVNPGAAEVCDNGSDDNCDGLIDADDPQCAVCTDSDGDGYAVEGGACGSVDCDDAKPAVNPGAAEVCDNGSDDDCDGLIDADDPDCVTCTDADGDGYAVEGGTCGPVDCDDASPAVNPGAAEVCDNGSDDDCDGLIDADDPICVAPNIIVVGWDGTQRDHFWQCYNKELSECPDGLANIQQLSGGVIFDNTITNGATETKPGWAQIFTGYNAEVTGVLNNGDYQPIPEGYTVFEKIENHFGPDNVVTMFISGKGVHTGGACVGDPTFKNGQPVIEDQGQPWCLTKEHLDYFELNQNRNDVLANRALELLETHQHDLFFALFLFRDPDVTGHMAGEDSVQYSEAMIDVDYWLGRIVAKLNELGIDERTLVYVTTDHGFDEGKSVHLNAPYGFFATNDPLVVRSGDRRDIAPTFLERYGISRGAIGGAPAVDGYSLYSIPPLACIPEGEAYMDYAGAPICCTDLQLISLDKKYGGCIPATGGTGDNSGYCTNCGNGACETPESKCNCPNDCPY